MSTQNKDWLCHILASITIVLWASSYVLTPYALQSYSPTALSLLRYMFGAAALVIFGCIKRIGLPKLRDVPKSVSYTHLDVYKRQAHTDIRRRPPHSGHKSSRHSAHPADRAVKFPAVHPEPREPQRRYKLPALPQNLRAGLLPPGYLPPAAPYPLPSPSPEPESGRVMR